MMACFGGIARAPLAIMLMVAEMTGSLTLLAPAMVAVGLSYLIVRRSDATIYRSQLKNRAESPAQRFQFGLPMLSGVGVAWAMSPPRALLDERVTVTGALSRLESAGVPGAPVVDGQGRFIGTLEYRGALEAVEQGNEANIGRLADPTAPTVPLGANLDVALDALAGVNGWVAVLDTERRVRGILATSDVVQGYRNALEANIGHLSRVAGKAVAIEERLGDSSPLGEQPLHNRILPDGCVVVSVLRANTLMFPNGDTVLQPGDLVSALVVTEQVESVRRKLRGDDPGTKGTNTKSVG